MVVIETIDSPKIWLYSKHDINRQHDVVLSVWQSDIHRSHEGEWGGEEKGRGNYPLGCQSYNSQVMLVGAAVRRWGWRGDYLPLVSHWGDGELCHARAPPDDVVNPHGGGNTGVTWSSYQVVLVGSAWECWGSVYWTGSFGGHTWRQVLMFALCPSQIPAHTSIIWTIVTTHLQFINDTPV